MKTFPPGLNPEVRMLMESTMLDFQDTQPQPIEQPEVVLSATSIAAIRDSNGYKSTLVLFQPTPATRRSVTEFMDQDIRLVISDKNGMFTPERPQRIVGTINVHGDSTMIVTTENQR